MDLNKMTDTIKAHPDFHKVGMIATHLGIVRSFSRNGSPVIGLDVEFKYKKVAEIKHDIKSRPGIIDIIIETNTGSLKVSDEVVAVMVAGDTRDNVFPALTDAINRIKSEAVVEKEKTMK
ncbi:MAG: molybdenum cofactor biosynthesis protein MoaE [Deltaproteobacteria bacterium]|nr:molybdenum cofactor biosynthesis protein MoaE [Deltaproteobacteria bacterium]